MLKNLFKKTTVQHDSGLDHMEELSDIEASSVVGGVGYVELAADDSYLQKLDVNTVDRLVGLYNRDDVVNQQLKRIFGI